MNDILQINGGKNIAQTFFTPTSKNRKHYASLFFRKCVHYSSKKKDPPIGRRGNIG